MNFSKISKKYENDSFAQKSASQKLFDLLEMKINEEVLDLGCGPGHLTKDIQEITKCRVIGIDPAEGMIEEAKRNYGHLNISFEVREVEQLSFIEKFDVIFCNSVFQWFRSPQRALEACHQSLKTGGRIGIQAPATQIYCPQFIQAIDKVSKNPSTKEIFSHFQIPWVFLENSEEYQKLFNDFSFKTIFSEIQSTPSIRTLEETIRAFDTGAAVGYLNPLFYDIDLNEEYIMNFRNLVKESFVEQSQANNAIELTFNRVYLIAVKP